MGQQQSRNNPWTVDNHTCMHILSIFTTIYMIMKLYQKYAHLFLQLTRNISWELNYIQLGISGDPGGNTDVQHSFHDAGTSWSIKGLPELVSVDWWLVDKLEEGLFNCLFRH